MCGNVYYINIKSNVERFLQSLDISVRIQVDKALISLKYYPETKGKNLGSLYSGVVFYEKRISAGGGIRIYYSVLPGIVIVDKIEYEGVVPVHKVGTKKTQRRDIVDVKRM